MNFSPTRSTWLFVILYLFLPCAIPGLDAQAQVASDQVKRLFGKPKKIKWIRHYTGKLGQVNDISMTIGYDGKRCKGRLIYAGSKEIFLLEGSLSGNRLSLKEKDRNDQTSGYLKGYLNKLKFSGSWSNQKKNFSQQLELNIAEAPLQHKLPCATDRWVRSYVSDAHQMLIQHLGEQEFSGYISLPGFAPTFHFKNNAQTSPGQLLFELLDPYGHQSGYLQFKLQEPEDWDVTFIDLQGKSQDLNFQLQEQFAIDCTEHADYMASYDITFPQTTSTVFNQWMNQLADDWIKGCDQYISVVGANETNYRPEMRATLRAYAWTDISFYNDQLISGQLAHHKSWSGSSQGQSFIYDLSAQRELKESDIFNPAFPRRAFLWEKVKSELPNFPMYTDKGFRQWLENNEFPYLTLCMEGLCFRTEFDMIYGQQQIIIPYKEVLPYLKKDCTIAVIARRQ